MIQGEQLHGSTDVRGDPALFGGEDSEECGSVLNAVDSNLAVP